MSRAILSLTVALVTCTGCVLDSRSLGAYVTPRPHHGAVDTATAAGLSHTSIQGESGSFDVVPLGDLDGDGFDDLAIVRQDQASDARATARIDLVYGRSDALPPHVDLAAVTDASFTIPWTRASVEIDALGDWDDDGFDDVAIAVAGDNGDDAETTARVHVLWGQARPREGTASIDTLALAAAGTVAMQGDVSSMRLTAVGDVDGDGVDDAVLRVPAASGVVLMRWSGGAAVRELPLQPERAQQQIAYEAPDAAIDHAVALGDLDGDGLAEIGVRTLPIDGGDAGDSWVLFGAADSPAIRDLGSEGIQVIDDLDTAAPIGGDFDGDGNRDLVIPRHDPQVNGAAIALLRGPFDPTQDTLAVEVATAADASCLERLRSLGDVDDDGRDDLAAATCDGDATTTAVFYGWPDGADTLALRDAGARFAAAPETHPHGVALGDVDGDGVDDWALVEDPYCVGCALEMRFHVVWGAAASSP